MTPSPDLGQLRLQLVLGVGHLRDASIEAQVGVGVLPPQIVRGALQGVVSLLAESGRVGPRILRIADVVVAEFRPCFRDGDSGREKSGLVPRVADCRVAGGLGASWNCSWGCQLQVGGFLGIWEQRVRRVRLGEGRDVRRVSGRTVYPS